MGSPRGHAASAEAFRFFRLTRSAVVPASRKSRYRRQLCFNTAAHGLGQSAGFSQPNHLRICCFFDGNEGHCLARRCHTMSYPRASASRTAWCNSTAREWGEPLRTYVQRLSPTIPPACPSVRTYAANHRKTPIYSDAPAPRSRKIRAPGDRRRWSHCCSIRDCTCPGWRSRHR